MTAKPAHYYLEEHSPETELHYESPSKIPDLGGAALIGAIRPPGITDAGVTDEISLRRPNFYPVPDAHISLSNNEARIPLAVVSAFEVQNYVRQAPDFAGQVADTTRTDTFRNTSMTKVSEMTEHAGLSRLSDFLHSYAFGFEGDQRVTPELRYTAATMLEQITFIGAKEFQEGTRGIAFLWRQYLDEHPGNVLCVPTTVAERAGKRKSDIYLLEHVLNNFSDDELVQYSGRIKTDVKTLTEDPGRVRIILLDDWIISGAQIDQTHSSIFHHKPNLKYLDRVEANFITAPAARIEQGIPAHASVNGKLVHKKIPVRAYYQANDIGGLNEFGAVITGTHSSTDYGFADRILAMLKATTDVPLRNFMHTMVPMPPLSSIVRPYGDQPPKITIGQDGIIRRNR